MELSYNLQTYLRLYMLSEETADIKKQDDLLTEMDKLYYELDNEDIAFLEEKQII